jgi:nitroreductase
MDLNEAITGRRAVRNYSSEAINDLVVTQLIEAAIQAPSAMNQQSYTFTVLRNQTILNRISDASKAFVLKNDGAAAFRSVSVPYARS